VIFLKLERSNVDFPLWRKKVDSSLFRYNGTTIPNWACKIWGIAIDFSDCNSKNNPLSKVQIKFSGQEYCGWVTVARKGRKTPAYRLWYTEELSDTLKDVFLMSFVRDIEDRLRKAHDKNLKNKIYLKNNIEGEIPFWEFLDIEYDRSKKRFRFVAYYTQKPVFSELFKRFIESPILHKIDDELEDKKPFRIYKSKWQPRNELDATLETKNVLYFLIDTKDKLLYIGEATNLKKRLMQDHPSIPNWNYFRYNILPKALGKRRKTFERMVIRDYASFLENKKDVKTIEISEYKLANDKIDVR
jgi:hypothetical protein